MGGFSPQTAVAEKRGFQYDRRWMLTDTHGRFISQREYPQLAQWFASIEENDLIISHRQSAKSLRIEEAHNPERVTTRVKIWRDVLSARNIGKKINQQISKLLDIECSLVFMGLQDRRPIDNLDNAEVSFADAYPYLITNTASLDALSKAHGSEIIMNRFRPNIVIESDTPWQEDTWKLISIEGVSFEIIKPCARCQVPGIDQITGAIDNNILKTMSAQRRFGNKVLFGVNAILADEWMDSVQVGDEVDIVQLVK